MKRRIDRGWVGFLAFLLWATPFALAAVCLLCSGCSSQNRWSGDGPTAPTPEAPDQEATLLPMTPVPAYYEGFFVEGRFAAEPPGTGHVYIMSWDDNPELIRTPGFVSVHCCVWRGGRFDPSDWELLEERWLRPLARRGMLMGLYLVDEPGLNGIPDDQVVIGAEFARQRGYVTMATRAWRNRDKGRLPVDYYSVTGYSFETKKEWVRDFHREADTDFVVGQAFDAGPGYDKGMPDQRFWRETARMLGKPIISWSWRWPGQYSCADDPECMEVWGE